MTVSLTVWRIRIGTYKRRKKKEYDYNYYCRRYYSEMKKVKKAAEQPNSQGGNATCQPATSETIYLKTIQTGSPSDINSIQVDAYSQSLFNSNPSSCGTAKEVGSSCGGESTGHDTQSRSMCTDTRTPSQEKEIKHVPDITTTEPTDLDELDNRYIHIYPRVSVFPYNPIQISGTEQPEFSTPSSYSQNCTATADNQDRSEHDNIESSNSSPLEVDDTPIQTQKTSFCFQEEEEYHESPISSVTRTLSTSCEADENTMSQCSDITNILLLKSGDIEQNPGPDSNPGKVTELELHLLADNMDPNDFRKVGRALKFTEAQLSQFEEENGNVSQAAYKMLCEWLQTVPDCAAREILVNRLDGIQLTQLADTVRTELNELTLWKISELISNQQFMPLGLKLGLSARKIEALWSERNVFCSQNEINFKMLYTWYADQQGDSSKFLFKVLTAEEGPVGLGPEEALILFSERRPMKKSSCGKSFQALQLYSIAEELPVYSLIPLGLRLGLTYPNILDIREDRQGHSLNARFNILLQWQKNQTAQIDQIEKLASILEACHEGKIAFKIRHNDLHVTDDGNTIEFSEEQQINALTEINLSVKHPNKTVNDEAQNELQAVLDAGSSQLSMGAFSPHSSGLVKWLKKLSTFLKPRHGTIQELIKCVSREGLYRLIGITLDSIHLHVKVYTIEGLRTLQRDVQSGHIGGQLARVLSSEKAEFPEGIILDVSPEGSGAWDMLSSMDSAISTSYNIQHGEESSLEDVKGKEARAERSMASAIQPTTSELDEQSIQTGIDGDSIQGDSIRPEVEGEASTESIDIKSRANPNQAVEDYKQDDFSDILKTLGLDKYYASKISLLNAMVIKKTPEKLKLVDLPWEIIHKLLMIDFHARDQLFALVKKPSIEERPEAGDDLEAILFEMQKNNDESDPSHVNPLDVLVAIFTCCDNFLRQTLAQKLFVCKLAIPFLYPLRTEGNVGMSLWALRTITVPHKEASETSVTEKTFPLVAFVRLGRPPLSKSKLINDILRDDSHNTFLHYDCNNGSVDRKIANGLIECSWFISGGNEKKHLPCTAMILNLRGDAALMTKHVQLLQKISSVVFVIATAKDLARTPNTETCQQIVQSDAKVILFLINGNDKQSTREIGASLQAVGKEILKGVPIILSSIRQGIQKNASDLKNEAREKLSEAIAGCSGKSIEDCAERASEMGVIIDENGDKACLEGRRLAENVVSHMGEMVGCKDRLLPLQGAEWIEYCKLLKEQHRASGKDPESSSAHHADKLQQEMDRLREKQAKICHDRLPPFIIEFMAALHNNLDVVMYFLKWMNLLLDGKSRATLSGLRRQYKMAWTKFQEVKKKKDKKEVERLKSKLDDAEKELASASLGLENLFREIGQIYETSNRSGQRNMEYLPEIAAKLLLRGIPLELIDGDASSVPITWVTAVLSKLGIIIGEKRLFVLSVLGVQSSGKSTLLNTMFGLQFAVSAGRCTRGAYMQLIPVDEHADLPFHYVVVVDTEGLRAPEQGQIKHDHDNELATLVIGIGDVTIINIKGENTTEIKDILQIAVHAFLRMNRVKKHVKDHRTCIFVHQNAAATNVEELNMQGHYKLQESLDAMAKEAAISEHISNIHSFSQIINFNVREHVWYFSDLWHGDPPMAPANPGYSQKIDAVRTQLLREITKEQTTFLTISDLSIRLEDIWKGVLTDDFVFSFRNTLEAKAYNDMQSEYYTLEWGLHDELKRWLNAAEIKLKMCETFDELGSCFLLSITKLPTVLTEKAKEIKRHLLAYFNNSNLQEIVIQWQQSKLNLVDSTVVQLSSEGREGLLSIKEERRVEILQNQEWSHHKESIWNKAVELADTLKGKEATSAELKEKFDAMWVSMVNEFTTNTEDHELVIDYEMAGILHDRFPTHISILHTELSRSPLTKPLPQTCLENSIRLSDVEHDHISLKESPSWLKLKDETAYNPELQAKLDTARQMTVNLTEGIFKTMNDYLQYRLKQDVKLQKMHVRDVVHTLVEALNGLESEDRNFMIRPKYVVKIAVHICRHIVQVLSKMQCEYNSKHGVKAKLQSFKETSYSLFENMVKQSTEEVMAGGALCTALSRIVQKAVKDAIPTNVVEEIRICLPITKYKLMKEMMIDLAKKDNFQEYKSYIENSKNFALRWITEYTDEKMFSKRGSSISRYAEIAKSHIARIIQCITDSVHHATSETKEQKGTGMALWIEKFCHRVKKEIAVPVTSLVFVSARTVKNFNHLQKTILDQLGEIKTNLEVSFAKVTHNYLAWNGTPPPQEILNKIWGCPEQCPICNEPCRDTTPNHYTLHGICHTCVQHRPIGLIGTHSESDDKLCHECCNYLVQLQNKTLYCGVWKNKCRDDKRCTCTDMTSKTSVVHKFTEYKTYLPDWDIAPDSTNNVSKYWMWFMATYEDQLKDIYKVKLPDIPLSWRSITKEEALDYLRKTI